MPKASSYKIDSNISNKDIVFGSDGDKANQSKNYSIGDLKEFFEKNFTGEEQDNIIKNLFFSKNISSEGEIPTSTISQIINSSESFEITSKEIYFFSLRLTDRIYVFTLKNKGSGIYGVGGETLSASNFQIISETFLSLDSLIKESTTEVIPLFNIGSLDINEAVNQLNPPVEIKPVSNGFTVFTATQNGVDKSWFYQGDSGLFGLNESQTILSDFDEISTSGSAYSLSKDKDDLLLNFNGDETSRVNIPSLLFSANDVSELKALIYQEASVSLLTSPTSFEKNLSLGVTVNFDWNVILNDDNLVSAIFDGSDISSELNSTSSFNSIKDSLTKSISVELEDSNTNQTRSVNISRTSNAINPQWKGSSNDGSSFDGLSYSILSSSLNKFIQQGSNTSITVNPGKYGVFLSNRSNAEIREQGTGFKINESAYSENQITVSYEDGTSFVLNQYIINPSNGTFTYVIN